MSRFARWVGAAAFCAVFGFAGSAGAVLALQGHLRGEPGPAGSPGPAGVEGRPGPVGKPGPAADDGDVTRLQYALTQLDRRLVTLESAARPGEDCALVTQLVTDVSIDFSGNLSVSHTPFFVCVNPG